MTQRDQEHTAVNAFVTGSAILGRIETQVGRPRTFNIFEAIGATRQELRHSDFLAFLLDPQETHGLGDGFLRSMLLASMNELDAPIDPTLAETISTGNLAATRVRREWQNIDILLVNTTEHLVVIIENKIGSDEHSGQLGRYYKTVQAHFPAWTVYALYLTPDSDRPSDTRYRSIGYGLIGEVVDRLVESRPGAIDATVRSALQQYTQMLRRHVVGDADSELARLCRRAYREHEQAINLITRYRQQRQKMIQEFFESLVNAASGDVRLDQGHVSGHWYFTRFAVPEWDIHRPLLVARAWTKSHLALLFQFIQTPRRIIMDLAVGPGPDAAVMRRQLFDMAREHQPPFSISRDTSSRFFSIYSGSILAEETHFFEEYSDAEIKRAILDHWEAFRAHDLPAIRSVIQRVILEPHTHA